MGLKKICDNVKSKWKTDVKFRRKVLLGSVAGLSVIGGYAFGKKTSVDRMGKYIEHAYNEGVCTANTTIQRGCEEMGKIIFVSQDDIPITKIYTVTKIETKE